MEWNFSPTHTFLFHEWITFQWYQYCMMSWYFINILFEWAFNCWHYLLVNVICQQSLNKSSFCVYCLILIYLVILRHIYIIVGGNRGSGLSGNQNTQDCLVCNRLISDAPMVWTEYLVFVTSDITKTTRPSSFLLLKILALFLRTPSKRHDCIQQVSIQMVQVNWGTYINISFKLPACPVMGNRHDWKNRLETVLTHSPVP